MNIDEQFNLVATEYDVNRRKFIECYDDYYIKTTEFLASNVKKPNRILDLGTGTGLLPSFWYRHFSESEYVLVDIAGEMMEIAKKRFAGIENVLFQKMDYTKELPEGNFDIVMSALSIHHLNDNQKQQLFKNIYNILPKGAMFVNYDQFCADSKAVNEWYDKYWENNLKNSGLSEHDLKLWEERRKFDIECSVSDEVEMLRKSNFSLVQCVYSYQKFSVIVAIK